MILYLDIETAPNRDMVAHVDAPIPATADDAPKNYKNPETIDNWIIKENANRNAAYIDRIGKMSLDIDFARITELGYALGDGDVQVSQVSEEKSEWDVLHDFWAAMRTSASRICGFNILGFDLPIILRRSLMVHVTPTCAIDMRRYSTASVIDLMQLFYHWGQAPGPRYRGLKAICEMHGIENKFPDLDGSMMGEMDTPTRAAYCANDVTMVRALAGRMKGYYW